MVQHTIPGKIQGAAEWTPIFQRVIKTNETSYRKKLYIFEKYLQSSFFPLGFESNITQVAAVIRDALPKPFSKVYIYTGIYW